MPLPIWTSTKNSEDKSSEDAFIKGSEGTLVRVIKEDVDFDIGAFNAVKDLRAATSVMVGEEWIKDVLPRIIEMGESAESASLKHVGIKHEDGILHTFAMTDLKVLDIKTKIKERVDIPQKNFLIAVSLENIMALYNFVSKAFGYGNCEIAAKISNMDICESLAIVPFSEVSGDSGVDQNQKPELKLSIIKIARSVGEFAADKLLAPQNFVAEHSASIKHTQKWAFSKKTYVELKSNAGILEVSSFDDKGTAEVRASLGAKIISNCDIKNGETIAYLDGRVLHSIMSIVSSPITIKFGTVIDSDGEEIPSKVVLESDGLLAVLPQMYEKDGKAEVVKYVTHKAGKVIDSTPEEAATRAIKQNKGAGGPSAASELSVINESSPKKKTGKSGKNSDNAEGNNSSESAEIQENASGSDEKGSKELLEVVATENPTKFHSDLKVEGEKSTFKLAPVSDIWNGSEEKIQKVIEGLSKVTNDLLELSELLRQVQSEDSVRSAAFRQKQKDVTKRKIVADNAIERAKAEATPAGFSYDIDKIGVVLGEYAGTDVKIADIIERFIGIMPESSIYSFVTRLFKCGVITRKKVGTYSVPEDYQEKYTQYRTVSMFRPRRKKLPEEAVVKSLIVAAEAVTQELEKAKSDTQTLSPTPPVEK